MYGTQVELPPDAQRARSLIGEIGNAPAGNVIIRVGRGRTDPEAGWFQTEHLVLTPTEARDLAAAIGDAAERGAKVLGGCPL